MKLKKYIEYYFTILFFYFFKLLGLRISSFSGGCLLFLFGLLSKRNSLAIKNLRKAFPDYDSKKINKIIMKMWFHFGRVIGEYPNLNKLKIGDNKNIIIENKNNLIAPLKSYSNCF